MSRFFIVIIHAVYWLLFLGLLLLFYSFLAMVPGFEKVSGSGTGVFTFWIRLMTGFAVIPAVISFYCFYTFLFTKLLARKKFLHFCLSGILVSFVAAITGALAESTPALFGKKFLFNDSYRSALAILLVMSIGAAINGVIGAIIRGFITWYNDIRVKENLVRKNLEMELDIIRAHLQPHFLFNTLNNIDVLIEKDQEKASEYLRKLSDILRFMLYETKSGPIPASRELEYISKYLALQQLRNHNPAFVDFRITGEIKDALIEPMIFMPFIENAFKYSENKKEVNAIRIHIEFNETNIAFHCTNSYTCRNNSGLHAGGLGQQLIEKRLDLLYPDKHRLHINDESNKYTVHLTIEKL